MITTIVSAIKGPVSSALGGHSGTKQVFSFWELYGQEFMRSQHPINALLKRRDVLVCQVQLPLLPDDS